MNKTTKIIITAIIIIMLAAGFFAFFAGKKPAEVANEPSVIGDFPDTGDSAVKTSSRSFDKESSSSRTGKETSQNILTKLTENAISGAAYYGTSTALYMERATGHIYKINLDGTNKIRLSNATVPKSFEAV